MATILEYYNEYRKDRTTSCPDCGWTGVAGDLAMEMYDELFDLSCPKCDKMLLIVAYPTGPQTKAAAEAGNAEAIKNCRAYGIDFREPDGHAPAEIA
jgi:predicted RNA-binding Zn-ribbon protein involved in translation (DUF1610 family)